MSEHKKAYTFEEDTLITAQAVANMALSTKEGVDPVPFIAALLKSYAERVRTGHAQPSVPNVEKS